MSIWWTHLKHKKWWYWN